nr:transglutaminase-like domain-containing protein [Raoultibacter timonensis]
MERPHPCSIGSDAKAVLRTVGIAMVGCVLATGLVTGCADPTGLLAGAAGTEADSEATGETFSRPELTLSPIDLDVLIGSTEAGIDVSHLADGYVSATATSKSRLKLQVTRGDMQYNYDLPSDGTPISVPLNMGNGSYTFQIMQNTRDNLYVGLGESVDAEVRLADEFQPFLRPNIYCDYDAESLVVEEANKLSEGARNQADVLKAVYDWIVENVSYDNEKAKSVVNGTIADGYLPDPDATMQSKTGICFDYASLAAAMLRSQGIPCKIITGYVSPDSIYHAWNMVYLNGEWISAKVSVKSNTWTRVDFTFAAGGATDYAGDGMTYTDKYTY